MFSRALLFFVRDIFDLLYEGLNPIKGGIMYLRTKELEVLIRYYQDLIDDAHLNGEPEIVIDSYRDRWAYFVAERENQIEDQKIE